MNQAGGIIKQSVNKQVLLVLNNERYAFLLTVILALVPMMTFVSVALVALITMRKGWKPGLILLLAGLSSDVVVSSLFLSVDASLYHAFLEFVPCYIAAVVLRHFLTWRAVFWVLLVFVMLVVALLQLFYPAYIEASFKSMSTVMMNFESNSVLLNMLTKDASKLWPLANLFLGIQLASVLLSTLFSLSIARSKQAELFYPGAYLKELLIFKADQLALFVFIVISIAAYHLSSFALALLPTLVLYFTLAGILVAYQLMHSRRVKASMIWLLLPLILMPLVMIPVYILFGSLDSLVNIRLLIPRYGDK